LITNRVLYVSPVYKPAIGGGVVYIEMLAKYCVSSGQVEKFTILTEKFPSMPAAECDESGSVEIRRLFPFRAGKSLRSMSSYIAYLIQNFQYLFIPFILYKQSKDVFIVHSSLHNNINVLPVVLYFIRLFMPHIKCVVDIRDPKLPVKSYWQLRTYHLILSCSENITSKLKKKSNFGDRVLQIPIPVENFTPTKTQIDDVQSCYGALGLKYIFLGSGSSVEKGVVSAMGVMQELRSRGHAVSILIAGKQRYWDSQMEQAKKEGWLIYLDQIPHSDVIILAAGAWVDLNLSTVDSLPRHSLEVLVAGGKALLPDNVPEFTRWCPDSVARRSDVVMLANQIEIIGDAIGVHCEYPSNEHFPDAAFKKIDVIFNSDLI